MKKVVHGIIYLLLFGVIVIVDRITKLWALHNLDAEFRLNEFIAFDFVLNRGISWSMFHAQNSASFILLTSMIMGITLFLASYAYRRWHDEGFIIGEVMVLAGGISNIVDRFLYKGVIDFIVLSFKDFTWPVFNVADIGVVIGVFIMLVSAYREYDPKSK